MVSARKLAAAALCWTLACPAYPEYRPAMTATTDTVPLGINYQGRLLKDNFPVTSTKIMVFKVFDALTGGTLLWNSGNMNVDVKAGIFGVTLDIPKDVLLGPAQKYLEVDVDINTLSPRDPLLSVPYAKMAETVEGTIEIGPSATLAFTTASLAGYGLVLSSDTGRAAIGTTPASNRSRLEIRPDPTDNYALFVSSQDGTPFLRVDQASGLWFPPANPLTAAMGGTGGSIGGVAGAIPYYTAAGVIGGVSAVGNAGELLRSGAGGAPTWLAAASANTASTVVSRDGSGNFSAGVITASMTGSASGTATYATNLAGGAANRVPYQTGAGVTAFIPAGGTNDVLSVNGSGVPVWVAPGTLSAGTAIDLTGGGAGQLPYQFGPTDTRFTAVGVAGQVLRSAGAGTPTWVNQSTLGAGTAATLSANGSNCAAGDAPLGVDASGAAEGCFTVSLQGDLDAHAALTGAAAHGADPALASSIVLRDGSGSFTAGTISATLNQNIPSATAWAGNGSNCAAGDSPLGVAANGDAEGCFDAATQVELNAHAALTNTAHGAATGNTPNAIVARDGSGNFSAGTVTAAAWVGNAATASALAANGSNCAANNVALGVNAAGAAEGCLAATPQGTLDTHAALTGTAAHGAASANTASAIVARDVTGNFSAGTITAALAGNATTASAWAANGSNCAAGNTPLGVDASGGAQSCLDVATGAELGTHTGLTATAHGADSANTASMIAARDASGNFSAGTITAALAGTAGTMTSLAANGSNCGSGLAPLGIDASGAAEGCYDVAEPSEGTTHGNLNGPAAHSAASGNTASAIVARDASGNFSASAVILSFAVQLWSRTKGQLQAITPTAAGQVYYCSNCGPGGWSVDAVVSTGTLIGQFATVGDGSVPWQ